MINKFLTCLPATVACLFSGICGYNLKQDTQESFSGPDIAAQAIYDDGYDDGFKAGIEAYDAATVPTNDVDPFRLVIQDPETD